MLLTVFPQKLVAEIGHDGSEIVFPDEPEPLNRRGFYIEEINRVLMEKYSCVLVSLNFPGSPAGDAPLNFDGILLGRSVGSSSPESHAVVWKASERRIYDPNGSSYRISNFITEGYYGLFEIAHRRA